MPISDKLSFVLIAIALASPAHADEIGNTENSSWADTPKGRFECFAASPKIKQDMLKFAGRVIFRGSFMAVSTIGGPLSDGILNSNIGCPWIVASNRGYVVISRQTQPPSFGISGYALIDFNVSPPVSVELAEAQSPQDDKIPEGTRIKWNSTSIELKYFGYPIQSAGGDVNSPKPRSHLVRYNIESGDVSQVR